MLNYDKSPIWPISTVEAVRNISASELIIFDCDGVLLDSEIVAARVHARAFARIGWPVSESELMRRFAGIPEAEMYEAVSHGLGRSLPSDHEQVVESELEYALRHELKAVAGVHDLLVSVRLPKCVASNSSPARLKFCLSLTGLYDQFAPDIFSAAMVARGKPAPDLYLFAAKQMGYDPCRCIAIEDSVVGVRAAVGAGIRVIGFCGASHCGEHHAAKLVAAGAMMTIGSMRELGVVLAAAGLLSTENNLTAPSRQL